MNNMDTTFNSSIEPNVDSFDYASRMDLTEWDFQSNSEIDTALDSIKMDEADAVVLSATLKNTISAQGSSINKMILYVWPGDYGLPSMDPECIRAILYSLFTKAPVDICYPRNPVWLANELPTLISQGHRWKTYHECMEQFRFQRYSLDFSQTFRECSETHAFVTLCLRHLEPILEYVTWVEKTNFEDLTRLWYMKLLPPLVNMYYVHGRRRKAFKIIKAQENLDDEAKMKEYLTRGAQECFHILSTRLGKEMYFHGDSPSSLDCVVYAYLAPLLKVPFPCDEIPRLLKGHDRLVEYVRRIDENFQRDMIEVRARILPGKSGDEDEGSSLGLKVLSSLFVACAMLGYALSHKIVQMSRK